MTRPLVWDFEGPLVVTSADLSIASEPQTVCMFGSQATRTKYLRVLRPRSA
jgi:hypothetical protein